MAKLVNTALLILLSGTAFAQTKQALLVDRSGSMKPYYQSGTIQELTGFLENVLSPESALELYAFGTTVTRLQRSSEIEAVPLSSSTLLDRAVERAITARAAIAWMVTDNVQDQPGATEAANTQVFYRKLRSETVRKITIFPLRQSPGNAGLVIYALLLDDSAWEVYERALGEIARRGKNMLRTEALRMKPLNRDTVALTFVRTTPKTAAYNEGQPVQERFEIRFKSKFDHIEITEGQIKVVEANPQFDSASLLSPERRTVVINPRKVRDLAAGGETEQIYSIDVDLGTVRLKKDLASLWRAAWGKSAEDATLKLQFLIEVPQRNLHLRPQFISNYHAATVKEAQATGKIYAVDQLPSLMSEQITELQVASPVTFRIRYPWWPSVLWIACFAVAAGLVFIAIRALSTLTLARPRDWAVQATTERGAPLEAAMESHSVMVQRDRVGAVVGATFTSTPGVVLEGGARDVKIQPGEQVRVRTGDRTIILVFTDKKTVPQQPSAAAARAGGQMPRRR